jgi:hypothetical protein
MTCCGAYCSEVCDCLKDAAPQAVEGQTTAAADEPGTPEPGPAVLHPFFIESLIHKRRRMEWW